MDFLILRWERWIKPSLVGGFNPFEKYQSKWESSPGRGEHEKYLKPPASILWHETWSTDLVGGWTNPSEKYQSNWIISPRIGLNMLKITYIWNHLVIGWCSGIFILVYKVIAEYNWVPYVSSQQHYSQGSPFGGHCWQSGQWSSLQ